MYFFVYGTLKLGNNLAAILAESAMYITDAVTVNPKWSLYTNGTYPTAVFDGLSHGIYGQVWEYTTFPDDPDPQGLRAELDYIEGYPTLFDRKLVTVNNSTRSFECTMYFLALELNLNIWSPLERGVF